MSAQERVIEFLTARLAEDEAVARAAAAGYKLPWTVIYLGIDDVDAEDAAHIARFDPGRVLRDVAARQAILASYAEVAKADDGSHEPEYAYGWADGLGMAVRTIAAVYSNHPDYGTVMFSAGIFVT